MTQTTSLRQIELQEAAGEAFVTMSAATASEIARLGIATVSPSTSSEWRITGVSKVGVLRVGDVEVSIQPKVPLERLFYLLARGNGLGRWFEESVRLGEVDDLYPAIAEAFATWAENVLRGGFLRGYREMRSAEPAIRGRWLVAEQVRVRHGMVLPAELQYDDFTSDIAENQLVRSAAIRLVRFNSLPNPLRARLMRVNLQLAEVTLVTRGKVLPHVHFDRRNERYRPVVALAELILTNGSLDHRVGSAVATGFLIDLPRVFEKFVEAEMVSAARPFGGEIFSQSKAALDRDGHVRIRPDLVWFRGGRVQAVFDAKYKAEKPAGFPNADVYQMLAYCIRYGLPTGHLIYAAGNEVPARYTISQAGVDIYCHSLALDLSPDEISRQVEEIFAKSMHET